MDNERTESLDIEMRALAALESEDSYFASRCCNGPMAGGLMELLYALADLKQGFSDEKAQTIVSLTDAALKSWDEIFSGLQKMCDSDRVEKKMKELEAGTDELDAF